MQAVDLEALAMKNLPAGRSCQRRDIVAAFGGGSAPKRNFEESRRRESRSRMRRRVHEDAPGHRNLNLQRGVDDYSVEFVVPPEFAFPQPGGMHSIAFRRPVSRARAIGAMLSIDVPVAVLTAKITILGSSRLRREAPALACVVGLLRFRVSARPNCKAARARNLAREGLMSKLKNLGYGWRRTGGMFR